jgi:hypothetical protein
MTKPRDVGFGAAQLLPDGVRVPRSVASAQLVDPLGPMLWAQCFVAHA